MGARAYLLIDVIDNVSQQQFVTMIGELEGMPGIEFVDPVGGIHDLVVIVDTPQSIDSLVTKLKSEGWVKSIQVLPIISVFERQGTPGRNWM